MTRPEALLSRFYEFRAMEEKRAIEEKRTEKQFLSQISLSMAVPVAHAAPAAQEPAALTDVPEPVHKHMEVEVEEEEQEETHDIIDDDEQPALAPTSNAKKQKRTSSSSSSSSSAPTQPEVTTKIKKRKATQEDDDDDDDENEQQQQNNAAAQKLFSPPGLLASKDWDPSTNPHTQDHLLDNFSLVDAAHGKQTLALRLTVPPDAKRWSINISPRDHCQFTNVLLHFNPRYKKKQLEMNDKQGTWGTSNHRTDFQALHAQVGPGTVDLVIHIRADGFSIYSNGRFCTFFPHRRDITRYGALRLTVPALDDNGNQEKLVLHKVWWGRQDPFRYEVPTPVLDKALAVRRDELPAGPRTVTIEGLPALDDGPDMFQRLMDLEAPILVLFEEYAAEAVGIVPGGRVGYIKLADEGVVDEAIAQLQGAEIGGCVLQLSRWQDVDT